MKVLNLVLLASIATVVVGCSDNPIKPADIPKPQTIIMSKITLATPVVLLGDEVSDKNLPKLD